MFGSILSPYTTTTFHKKWEKSWIKNLIFGPLWPEKLKIRFFPKEPVKSILRLYAAVNSCKFYVFIFQKIWKKKKHFGFIWPENPWTRFFKKISVSITCCVRWQSIWENSYLFRRKTQLIKQTNGQMDTCTEGTS